MPDQVIDVIFEPGAAYLQFFDFLVRGEVDFLLDAIHLVVQEMVLIEHLAEVIVRAFKPFDDVAMFREFSIDGMMQIHSFVRLDSLWVNVFRR